MTQIIGLRVRGKLRDSLLLNLPFWIETYRFKNKKHRTTRQ